jgi:hypothetical protein
VLFLSPLLLWFLAAAAIPIAIHLLNRRRHKTIQWAAMQFLLKATRESRGKKKLRHILILTCRALGIAALAMAAARPIASSLMGWGGGTVNTVVLVLDRSASMESRPGDGLSPRRQLVLEQVRSALKDIGSPRLVLIDSASGRPQDVPSADVLPELSSTAATDSAADFPSLLSTAAEFLSETPGRSEIWLASDLQSSNWNADDERWATAKASIDSLPQKPAIRVISLSGNTSPNNALRLISSRRSGNDLLLDLEILRPESVRGTANLPLTTHLEGGTSTETLTIPGQAFRFQKRIILPPDSTTGHGHLTIPGDGNPRDNVVFFAYGPARPVKSLVVGAAGEAVDYLLLAAAPPGFGGQSAEFSLPAQAASIPTNDLAAIVWAAPFPNGATADWLDRFLKNGGQVLFLPAGEASTESFLDLKWSQPTEAERGKFFILQDWNHADGPLRDGIDGTPIPAERLKAVQRQIPAGDVAPLAKWEDGEPFLSRRVVDRGTAWFLGSIPDYTWSNLGDADVLLPVVQRIVTAGAYRFDASYLGSVGGEETRTLPGETRTRLDNHGEPDPANAAYEAGVHRLGSRLLAINRPLIEDEPEILTREQLDGALDGTGYTLLDQAGQATEADLSRDLWRPFLIAVIFFLISEAILSLPKKQPVSPLPASAKKANPA